MAKISAGGIILKEKRIFLLKRSHSKKAFPWFRGFPWWRWEENENFKEIAIREIKEEVGLDFKPNEVFFESIIWWWNSQRFLWDRTWNILLQEEEVDGYAWFSYNEAINLDLAFDYKEILEKLLKKWLIE